MKLCPKAQALKDSYVAESTYVGEYRGTSRHATRVTRDNTDKKALARAMHEHMKRCYLCST